MAGLDLALRVALLIDADNVGSKHAGTAYKNAAARGRVIVRRAYGGIPFPWRNPEETMLNYAIKPIVRLMLTPKKNACDIELVIDALRLAHQKMVDVVYIVSNDSDFTPLAEELKEMGIMVYGCGEKGRAQNAFVKSCDGFEYLDKDKSVSEDSTAVETEKVQQQKQQKKKIKSGVTQIEKEFDAMQAMKEIKLGVAQIETELDVIQTMKEAYKKLQDEDGWAQVVKVAAYIKRVFPAFSQANYGYTRFAHMIKATGIFEYNDDEKTVPKIKIKISKLFEIYSISDCPRWRLKDSNHQVIATSGEAFSSEDVAEESIKNILKEVDVNTPIVKDGSPQDGSANTRFVYFVGKDGQYYWHLQNKGNNAIIAVGGESFSSESNVIRSIENVRDKIVKNLPIE